MRWVPSSHAFRAPLVAAVIVAAGLAVNACSLTENESEVDVVAGKQLFVERCGSCHVLNRAGTKGTTGPNLDQAFQQGLKDGMGRSGIRGTVRSQINSPRIGSQMPADLVQGAQADQVAAYVAECGTLEVDADPSGQLAYVTKVARATPGELTVESKNESSVPHDITIAGKGKGEVVQGGGVSSFKADFTPGTYTFYCSVDGHRAAGMQGKLTVK